MKELMNGVLETPDRFIIFTADNIKSISPCLLSSGRIDVKIYLDKCSVDTILDMINGFYENELEIIAKNQEIYDSYNICWKKPLCITERFEYEELKNSI